MAANRTKTIEYAFDSKNSLLTATTRYDFSAITLYIPETTSRAFKSVHLEITTHETSPNTSHANVASILMGIKLGAVSFDDVTITDDINANATGANESFSMSFSRDVTSYFNTNFGTGTSQTCQAGVVYTQGGTNSANTLDLTNWTAKLIITYEYDDTAHTTRVKTVRIPIESNPSLLTNTQAEVGVADQIPNLDSFLPEASKTYRNIFLEIEGASCMANSSDYTLELQIDSGSTHSLDTFESQSITNFGYKYIWVQNSLTTSATHKFKARSNNLSGRGLLAPVLVVTYEYDHSSTTSVMNSLLLPLRSSMNTALLTSDAGGQFEECEVWIEEPSTITLAQSAVVLTHTAGSQSLTVGVGSQTKTAYACAGGAVTGTSHVNHRIDAGGSSGSAGFSIARGRNTIKVLVQNASATTSASQVHFPTGMIILNYTSGLHTSGDGVHNKTVLYSMHPFAADASLATVMNFTPDIIETNWKINAIGIDMRTIHSASTFSISGFPEYLTMEIFTGEFDDVSPRTVALYTSSRVTISSAYGLNYSYNHTRLIYSLKHMFVRSSSDNVSGFAELEVARDFTLNYIDLCWVNAVFVMTYHSITFQVAGDVAGSGGGTVTIKAHNLTSGEKVATTTRSGDGAYALTVFDNTEDYYTEAYEDSTHVGRSDTGTPT